MQHARGLTLRVNEDFFWLEYGETSKIFNLTPATSSYRSIYHSYKMVFVQNTVITRSNHMSYDLYLSLVDFQTVFIGSRNDSFLVGNYKSLIVLYTIYIPAINTNLFNLNIFCYIRCAGTGFGLW